MSGAGPGGPAPRIPLGELDVTPAAHAALEAAGLALGPFLERHAAGDWEEEGPALEENRFAARHGLRLVADYRLGPDETVDGGAGEGTSRGDRPVPAEILRIETTADRAETSVMLARERQVLEIGLREGYDRWSERYDRESNVLIAVEQPIVDGWVDVLPGPPGRALDAATGTGRHALRLLERGWWVTAFDASPGMVAVAKRPSPGEGIHASRSSRRVWKIPRAYQSQPSTW